LKCREGVIEAIVAHARDAAPCECCGILLGRAEEIHEAVRVRNLAESPTRYLLDPAEHISIRRDARSRGLDVLGFYHSHPRSPAEPSEADRAEAEYPGSVHLIVSVADQPAARLFKWNAATFEELALEAVSRSPAPEGLG
jgi:proteasome lid subunit RPN8/RPN11